MAVRTIETPTFGHPAVTMSALSSAECRAAIFASEACGYEAALLNVGMNQQVLSVSTRSSARCVIDSPAIAAELWARIRAALPAKYFVGPWRASCLNERLRFLRYSRGDFFRPHFDGCFRNERTGEVSQVTVMLYLNEGFVGGETTFPDPCRDRADAEVLFAPTTGAALVFDHGTFHSGALVADGVKYAIRTDIMFKRHEAD